MNDPNAERSLRKYKGFENSVKQMLTQEYKFLGGEKIQEMFIKDLLVEFNRHMKDGWKLDAGQVVWWAGCMVGRLYGGQRIKMNILGGTRLSRTPGWFRLSYPLPVRTI